MRKAVFLCVSLFLAWSATLSGQSAVTTRSTNLRHDPSTHHTPIRLLAVGEHLTLFSSQKRNGYYHVETSDSASGGPGRAMSE